MSSKLLCRLLTIADALTRLPNPDCQRFATIFQHGGLLLEIYRPEGGESVTP